MKPSSSTAAQGSIGSSERSLSSGLPALSKNLELLCLALITFASGWLCLFRLTSAGFTLDEGFSAYLGRISTVEFLRVIWNAEFNMVLYYALLRVWMQLGHSEFLIRLLSVLFATATVPAIYFLARRLFRGGWIALLAALLLALHPFHLVLARSARSYSLTIFLVTLGAIFFLRGLDNPRWANWIAYGFLSAAAVYSHYFAVLIVLAQAISLVFFPGRLPWKRLLGSLVLFTVLLIPAVAFLLHYGSTANIAWIAPTQKQQVLDLLYSQSLSKARSLTYIVAWTASLVCAFRFSREAAWPYRFTAVWLFVPVVLVLAASIAKPLLVDRYLSVCIPAGVMLAAAGVGTIARWRVWLAAILLALILFYSISNVRHTLLRPDYTETWREASAYVLAHAQDGDEVVLLPGLGLPTFDYYREAYQGRLPDLRFAYSAAEAVPNPPPQSVWFVGSVVWTPSWAAEAASFAQAHKDLYCEEPPQRDSGSVRVWQFRRCDGDGQQRSR